MFFDLSISICHPRSLFLSLCLEYGFKDFFFFSLMLERYEFYSQSGLGSFVAIATTPHQRSL